SRRWRTGSPCCSAGTTPTRSSWRPRCMTPFTPGVSDRRRPRVPARELPGEWTPPADELVATSPPERPAAAAADPARTAPAGPSAVPMIEARGVGRRNPEGKDWLVRDVSLVLNPGDRLAVVGASGAGKTVLLRTLALLDPLHAGTVLWRGHAVRGRAVPRYR